MELGKGEQSIAEQRMAVEDGVVEEEAHACLACRYVEAESAGVAMQEKDGVQGALQPSL